MKKYIVVFDVTNIKLKDFYVNSTGKSVYAFGHNKKRNLLLYLLTNCIPLTTALQMISIKGENTLSFWNFLIVLYN